MRSYAAIIAVLLLVAEASGLDVTKGQYVILAFVPSEGEKRLAFVPSEGEKQMMYAISKECFDNLQSYALDGKEEFPRIPQIVRVALSRVVARYRGRGDPAVEKLMMMPILEHGNPGGKLFFVVTAFWPQDADYGTEDVVVLSSGEVVEPQPIPSRQRPRSGRAE